MTPKVFIFLTVFRKNDLGRRNIFLPRVITFYFVLTAKPVNVRRSFRTFPSHVDLWLLHTVIPPASKVFVISNELVNSFSHFTSTHLIKSCRDVHYVIIAISSTIAQCVKLCVKPICENI